jgi:hypothetical protein
MPNTILERSLTIRFENIKLFELQNFKGWSKNEEKFPKLRRDTHNSKYIEKLTLVISLRFFMEFFFDPNITFSKKSQNRDFFGGKLSTQNILRRSKQKYKKNQSILSHEKS